MWLAGTIDCHSVQCSLAGASTQGGNGARCTMAKIGGNVVMIMMLLLMSIIIYYYMIHSLLYTSALLTFCLPFFLHCVSKTSPMFSKTSPMFLAITRESIVGFS